MKNKISNKQVLLCLLMLLTSITYGQKLSATFDKGIPEGWQVIDADKDGKTISWINEDLHGKKGFAGGKNIKDEYLISPKVSVTSSDKTLIFKQSTGDFDIDYNELDVYVVENLPTDNDYSSYQTIFSGFLGGYSGWENTVRKLDKYVNKNVYIVFHFKNGESQGTNNYGGIDDVTGPELYKETVSNKLSATFDTEIPKGWQVIDTDKDGKTISWVGDKEIDGRKGYAGVNQFENELLISPKVSVTESDKTLKFKCIVEDLGANTFYSLKVYAVETIPANNVYSDDNKIFEEDEDNFMFNSEWTEKEVDLSAFVNKNIHIVFSIKSGWGKLPEYCGIDDVTGPELYKQTEEKPKVEISAEQFNTIFVGETTTANVTVTNSGKAKLEVTDITLEAPFTIKDIDKKFTVNAGAEKTIEVTFSPTKAENYKKTLTLAINGEFDGKNTIDLTAKSLAKKPTVNLSVTDFPITVANKISTATLTVSNNGNATLEVTDITVEEPFLVQTEDKQFTIESGKEKTIELTFSPKSFGVFTKTITLTINGEYEGDNSISIEGKSYVPDLLYQDFEEQQMPPLGWTLKNHGSKYYTWDIAKTTSSVYEGNASAYAGKDGGILSTPKLKIAKGDSLVFYAMHSENYKAPLLLKYSTDNKTWNDLEEITTLTGDYQRIKINLDAAEGEHYIGFDAKNYVYIDNVQGPELLLSSESMPSSNPNPEHQANGQNNILELSWDKVLGADGYKITMGTETKPTELYDAKDLGDVSSLKIYGLQFGTKYIWQIIPYNNGIDAKNCPKWEFTTMADPTIKKFPFVAGFEEDETHAGWIYKNWYSGYKPHKGKLSARTTSENKLAELITAPINLPDNYNISFYWMNADVGGPSSKVAKHDTTYFEVSTDFGQKWEILRTLSPDTYMEQYKQEIVNLSAYAGNNVYLRWRYVSDGNTNKAYGVALDDILIDKRPTKPIAKLSLDSWNADTVNFGESKQSKDIFKLINIGVNTLKINKITISDDCFSTNLKADEVELAELDTVEFGFKYNGNKAGEHKVTCVIEFNNSESLTINLQGKTYAEQFKLWDAEDMEDFSIEPKPWRTINADSLPTWGWESFDFLHEGDSLGFIVFNPKACGIESETQLQAHSGDKFFASIVAKDKNKTANNDWLISPHIKAKANTEITFWAKTYTDQTGILEKFNVAVSTTGYQPADFKIISGTSKPIEAPYGRWQKYSFTLAEYNGQDIYVAIQCVSRYNHIFMLDDICIYDFDLVNDAPIFLSEAPTQVTENHKYIYKIKAEDSNFDDIKFTTPTLPEWLTLTENNDGTAILQGTPKQKDVGENNVSISISDGKLSTVQDFKINVESFFNNKPEFTTTPILKAKRDMLYEYTVKVTDAEDDNIELTLSDDSPKWLSITAKAKNTWLLSGIPPKAEQYTIKLIADDTFDKVEQSINLNVTEPIFKSPDKLKAVNNNNTIELTWNNTNSLKLSEDFEQEWLAQGWEVKQSTAIDAELTNVDENKETWFRADKTTFDTPTSIYEGDYSACIKPEAEGFQWLISPKVRVANDSYLNFYLLFVNKTVQSIKRYSNFKVIIISDTENKEVLSLSKDDKSNLYETPINISLTEYADKYIRIAFVYEHTNTIFPLFIDSITINSKTTAETDSDGKHIGYKIYRNNEVIKTINSISCSQYTDNLTSAGDFTYYVTALYTNPDGESAPSNKEKVVIKSTSIQDKMADNNFYIYPNPSEGVFTLNAKVKPNSDAVVEIYNSNGKLVYKNKYQQQHSIDISNCMSGVYMLRVIDNKQITILKLVIK